MKNPLALSHRSCTVDTFQHGAKEAPMTNQPTFSIRDNADGTATVFDGGVAVMTIERQRGTFEPDRGHGGGYVSLAYVARGHELVAKAEKGQYDQDRVRVGVASSSVEVSENVDPDTVRLAMKAARPLYVAGRIADLRNAWEHGNLADDYAAQIAEWLPTWREHGEGDLADAMEAFLDEVGL